MAKVKKAQVGRLVKKAISTVGRDIEKSAMTKGERNAERLAKRTVEENEKKGGYGSIKDMYESNYNRTPRSKSLAPATKAEAKIDARAKKIKKANDDYDKSVWDSYQKNGGKTRKSMKMGGRIKKAQAGKKVSPTYKNLRMGVRNEQYQITGQNKDVTPSSKDSARYRGGFEQGLKGMKGMKNEGQVEKMGRWEGQNVGKKKGKMGIKVKKAQSGVSVGKAALDQYKMMRNTRPATSGNPKASLPPSAAALRAKRMNGMKKGGKISKMSKKK